jgi:hypothetical protein
MRNEKMNPFENRMRAETGKATGMDERTASRSEYFSWINNTNEGSTEQQTLINLEFWQWLKDEFGLQLDIYAFDAGNVDGAAIYGKVGSFQFHRQFPRGFGPIAEKAAAIDTQLGLWGGPDGFGNTAEEERERSEMMIALCRDHHFALFKFDGVCGGLRKEKQDAFVAMMKKCREYSPNLIALNHRLDLGKGFPHVTTYLLGGEETYIDVFKTNARCGLHHRVGALERAPPPGLVRMTEDHGVCISSCVDFWEDDLILQAFNRCLILAPQIYGNPWFLPDCDYPRLARIFNLHRKYREILVNGLELPEAQYGKHAVSRGSETLRFLTLRNLTWTPQSFTIALDQSIGICGQDNDPVFLYRFHPYEKFIGEYSWGANIPVELPSFRAGLFVVSKHKLKENIIEGCDFDVIQDIPGKPMKIHILGLPGTDREIKLISTTRPVSKATIDKTEVLPFLKEKPIPVTFPGTTLKYPWHRKIGDLTKVGVPSDAEALYEATCFAADNNALEIRELMKAGESAYPAVQAARDAFVSQPVLIQRGLWDRFAFDGKDETFFKAISNLKINGGVLRVDFGDVIPLDRIIIRGHNLYLDCKTGYNQKIKITASSDLSDWVSLALNLTTDLVIGCGGKSFRYLRITGIVDDIAEIEGYYQEKMVDRSHWRASNLFGPYSAAPATKAWATTFVLEEIPKNSFLAIPIYGIHGKEGAYACCKVEGTLVGCPDRSPSYLSNVWEYYSKQVFWGYTYYLPLDPTWVGKSIEIYVLGLKGHGWQRLKPEVWISCYPFPYERLELELF